MLLNEKQIDTFKELINIGVGKSTSLLNEMIQMPIRLSIPIIRITRLADLSKEFNNLENAHLASIRLGFEGAFSGIAEIVFPSESAANLVSLLTGEEKGTPELDAVRAGTLNEVANVLLNGVLGSIGNLLEESFSYSLPSFREDKLKDLLVYEDLPDDTIVLFGETHFDVADLQVEGDIIILMELPAFENLKKSLNRLLEE